MSSTPLRWIAHELGLALLTETEDGITVSGAGSRAPEPSEPARTMREHILRLAGAANNADALSALDTTLTRARSGDCGSVELTGAAGDEWRVLAHPAAGDRVEVVIAPRSTGVSAEVQRRAALADMAAAVSHEVSNALSAIGGWVELLQAGHSGEPAEETLARIASCAHTAQTIARRLLDVVRDGSEAPREDVDLQQVLREISDLLHLSARAERVHLEVQTPGPVVVRAVRADLFSAVWNLTKNAVEASSAEGKVLLQLLREDDRVQVRVRDTGAGMAPETLQKVFTPYFSTKETGTGLGLALVQQAARSAGGTLEVQSDVGKGSEFILSLPRASHQSATYPQISMRVPRPAAAGLPLSDVRALVVDDDDALRDMVTTALELKGATVSSFASQHAVRDLTESFDIALIDMMLRDARGDELLADLRQRGVVRAALLVTGIVKRPRLVPGGEPDDWVRKPFELGPLVDRIQQTLERHRMLSAAAGGQRH